MPVTGNRLFRGAAGLLLRLLGWKIEGTLPDAPQYVIVAAPHTSNWDFPLMLLYAAHFGIKPYWMGKDSLFPRPFAGLMRWLGGIPIDRSAANNIVDQAVQAFSKYERFAILIPPEGTRKRGPRWKTGFYYIATGANVPILLGYLDFPRKRGGFGPLFYPTGDLEADLRAIGAFYADKQGLYPHDASPVLPEGAET